MASQSTPSPIPFLLLGLVTGGALLYVSYWVWPSSQRRNSSTSRINRTIVGRRQTAAGSRNAGSSTSSGSGTSLRRRNATHRANTHRRQSQLTSGTRREHDHSDGSTSSEDTSRGRRYNHDTEDDGNTTDHEYSALVDEDGYERLRMDDFGDNKHDGLQLMNLLYAIAEDQAAKGGITCNSCGTVPIRGLRYKCANCQDYDLCEGCEAAEVHIKSHVFMKIRIPIPPLANSRTKKLPPFYPGIPKGSTSTPDHLLQELLQKTHFDNVELDAMYSQYLSLSTMEQEGGGITRLTFEQALGPLGLEKNLITERIFRFFDQDNDGIINFKEMACGLSVLCKGNFDEKIDFAFQGYDLDGDGYISREELHEMFKAYFYLSMELIRDVVKTMENDLINNFEYQPGMPISSTFTAPIPREIGVRNNNNGSNATTTNNNNSNNNNNNNSDQQTTDDRRRTQEPTSPPTDWFLSLAPDYESNTTTPATTSPSTEAEPQETTNNTSSVPVYEDDGLMLEETQEQDGNQTSANRSLPPGAYGLVDADEFADEVEDEEAGPSNVADSLHRDPQENVLETIQPASVQASISLESAGDISEAEDSGVDSSGWQAGALSSLSNLATRPQNPSSAISTIVHPGDSRTSLGSIASSPCVESPGESPLSSDSESDSERNANRPRKDQPLPPTTASPHLRAPSATNTNLAWDRPHHHTASSTSYFHPSSPSATPSLAPALAIGFGLPQDASSSSSPPSYPTHHHQRHARNSMESSSNNGRNFDTNSRRLSSGTPYPSYASSSSAPAGSYANASYFSSTFPVMESISQDAIQEMVDKTFSAIVNPSKEGYITLEEFRAYVLTDAGILGWFDALGRRNKIPRVELRRDFEPLEDMSQRPPPSSIYANRESGPQGDPQRQAAQGRGEPEVGFSSSESPMNHFSGGYRPPPRPIRLVPGQPLPPFFDMALQQQQQHGYYSHHSQYPQQRPVYPRSSDYRQQQQWQRQQKNHRGNHSSSSSHTISPENQFQVQPLDRFKVKCAPFQQPVEIGSFSYDENRNFLMDDSQLKYYFPPDLTKPNNLSVNYDKYIMRNMKVDEHIDALLDALICIREQELKDEATQTHRPEVEQSRPSMTKADFVCYRGILTKIMCTPYTRNEPWELGATLYKEEHISAEMLKNAAGTNARHKLMSYWGYRFETICNISKPISELRRTKTRKRQCPPASSSSTPGTAEVIADAAQAHTPEHDQEQGHRKDLISETEAEAEVGSADRSPGYKARRLDSAGSASVSREGSFLQGNNASTSTVDSQDSIEALEEMVEQIDLQDPELTGRLDGIVDTNLQYCTVVRTKIGKNSIIMGAEVDCTSEPKKPPPHNPLANYIELKTSRVISNAREQNNFERHKLLKFWAQSFLPGVPTIIVGFRDDDGNVVSVETFKTMEIPRLVRGKENAWDTTICINFLDGVFNFLRKIIVVDDPESTYTIRWAYPYRAIEVEFAGKRNSFLTERFLRSFT
ncbi:hypothetical protein BGZ51_001839 [Haplosporangium sp. Z 767]|nr:hypothetical protein BGZ51_001839 [Haplosporangium sp. Z 767]